MQIGASSQSFLREHEYIRISDDFMSSKDKGLLNEMLRKKEDGSLYHPKTKILNTIRKSLRINKHLIINALHLQNKTKEEYDEILDDFKNFLDDYGITGILELHPADGTQKSWHFHFWTNNDSLEVYNLLKHYVIHNGYANSHNVDIEGKFDSFLQKVDPDDKDTKKYLDFKNFDNKWTNENTSIAVKESRKKELIKLREKATGYNEIVKEAITKNANVVPINKLALSEDDAEIRDKTEDIFSKIRANAVKQRENFFKDQELQKDNFQSRLSKIPKTDTKKRIEEIKREIARVNKRSQGR